MRAFACAQRTPKRCHEGTAQTSSVGCRRKIDEPPLRPFRKASRRPTAATKHRPAHQQGRHTGRECLLAAAAGLRRPAGPTRRRNLSADKAGRPNTQAAATAAPGEARAGAAGAA
eukprot:90861-Lingulodinium_polyedra.AAC.1